MSLPPDIVRELLGTFRAEVDDQLAVITESMLALEGEVDGSGQKAAVDAALRGAHNIKGGARGIGVGDVANIAHHSEAIFTAIRDGKLAFSGDLADLSLEAVDRIREALECFGNDEPTSFDVDELAGRLEAASKGEAAKDTKRQAPEPSVETTLSLSDLEEAAVAASTIESAASAPDAAVDEPANTPAPSSVSAPEIEQKAPPGQPIRGAEVIRVATSKIDNIAEQVDEIIGTKIEIDDHTDVLKRLYQDVRTLQQDLASGGGSLNELLVSSRQADGSRISATAAVADVSERVTQAYRATRSLGRHLDMVLNALQDHTRSLRLVPSAELTQPLARTVRDNARRMDKPVHFVVTGEDIEMDRGVLEMLQDPMLHLLRNAIDHGIEDRATRLAADKPETAEISIAVELEGARIRIDVSDDGGGIDVERVRAKAADRGLLGRQEVESLDDAEALDLIFRPGLSTKEVVTDLSGRGVGLDVVRSNLEKLNASIAVETELGKGTTFVLRVPLTLAAEQAIIVTAGGQQFAIPTTAVERVMFLPTKDVINVEAGQAFLSEGKPVPLRHLSEILEKPAEVFDESINLSIVVVSLGWRRVAFVVEEIIGQREMVVKPLQPPLVSVNHVAGGTIAGGGILLVLNPTDLLDTALDNAANARVVDTNALDEEEIAPRILVVDDSLTSRTMLKNILESRGFDVTVEVHGLAGWEVLQQQTFDLVVTDVEMPTMDGFEFTEKVKNTPATQDLPVIMVTSRGDKEYQLKGMEVGADAYVVKGEFEAAAPLKTIKQLI